MAELVVDAFEMIDVDDGQPMLLLQVRVAPLGRRLGRRFHIAETQHLGQIRIEGLAIEQAGQRVSFAVIQNVLKVAVDLQQAFQHRDDLFGDRRLLREFKAGHRGFIVPDGNPQGLHAVRGAVLDGGQALFDGGGEDREVRQRPLDLFGRGVFVEDNDAVLLDPGARMHQHVFLRQGNFEHPRPFGPGQALDGSQQGNVEQALIAVTRDVYNVFQHRFNPDAFCHCVSSEYCYRLVAGGSRRL